MSQLGQVLMETIEGVRNGTMPLDTAEQIHLVAHRHVMDRYADSREARRTAQVITIEKAKELLRKVS